MSEYYNEDGSFNFDVFTEDIRNAPVDPWNEPSNQGSFYGGGYDQANFAASYPPLDDGELADVSADDGDDAGESSQALVPTNAESSATADQQDGQGQVAMVEDEEEDGPADDSSDISGFDGDDLHRELLLAASRFQKRVGELIAFKDADWLMIKTDLEDVIEHLRESRDDFKEKFEQLQHPLAATPALESAGSTQVQDLLAEKATRLANLDQQLVDKVKEVERLDEVITSKATTGNGQASNLGAGDSNVGELVQTINQAREENTSLRSQLNAAPKAWPTRIQDLPEGDAIRAEISNMISTATGNYDKLQGDASNLQAQLNHATGPNGQLQLEINRLGGLVKPLSDQLDTKNQLIETLQKELRRLTSSDSDVKKEADRLQGKLNDANQKIKEMQKAIDKSASSASAADNTLAAKQTLLDTTTADLASANQKIKTLEAKKDRELAAAGKEISTLQSTAKKSADKVSTLETELKTPREDNDVLLNAKKSISALHNVKEENKLLKRSNFKLVHDTNKETDRLREINSYLVHKLNEPKRKYAILEARQTLLEMKRDVEASELAAAVREEQQAKEKKREEEKEREEEGKKIEEQKKTEEKMKIEALAELEIIESIPGGWSDNAKLVDTSAPSLPAPEIMDANQSSGIVGAINQKVTMVRDAYLQTKYTAIYFWRQWKTRILWAGLLLASFLVYFREELLHEDPDFIFETPQQKYTSVRVQRQVEVADTKISSSYERFVFGMPIVGCIILAILVCRYWTQRKFRAEEECTRVADQALWDAVQADILAQKQRQQEEQNRPRRPLYQHFPGDPIPLRPVRWVSPTPRTPLW
ncbi:hypothetical protein IFR05_002696 [Cadophora sp. M221]|nr:hypothetical protein IFR05_002696 [Cadophora sp. M221]